MTTSRRARPALLAALAVSVALRLAAPATAQEPPRARVGIGIGAGLLVGQDGSDFLDAGVSQWISGAFRTGAAELLHLHLEATRMPLEPDQDAPAGTRAENTLYTIAAGPQISAAIGPVRPFLAGLAGIAVGRWTLEGSGTAGAEPTGAESSFAWGGRGGLAVDIARGTHPVALLAEARIFDPGTLRFARARTDSGLAGYTPAADVAILSIRLGVTLGL